LLPFCNGEKERKSLSTIIILVVHLLELWKEVAGMEKNFEIEISGSKR